MVYLCIILILLKVEQGFLIEDDIRIVSLLIRNQISVLLKDRQHYIIQQQQDELQNQQNDSVANSPQIELIQKQQQQYKHTEIITLNLMEDSVTAGGTVCSNFEFSKKSKGFPLLLNQFCFPSLE
jgi:hypothetical protein